ncbi:small ribosomal subunit protein uS3m isoform X1 [Bos indicus]|uniref:Small ribosomal subunit protein uS3m isoform X1 n=1 Tax=Bos indicus TaxID=9915 RepID=A0ABM4RCV0_BOSIN
MQASAREGKAPYALGPIWDPTPAWLLGRRDQDGGEVHRCLKAWAKTSNLDGEDHAAERTVEDVFLRKFMLGTFPGCLADQLILKRRANQVEICALVLRQLPAHKFYFLVGYSETLLSHFYKCPVRLHLQTVPSKVVYKYI